MSDIRFNQWLHNSGTGGVSQVDGGHVGIGTTNPEIAVHSGNNKILNVGIVTASTYYGDGSNLSGIVGGGTSLSFNDNIGAYFGNSQDLKIYHDGNHSYIDDQGTGNLRLRSGTLEILNLAGNKTSAIFSSGGGQTLNFNNSQRFTTTNTGVTVTGSVVASGAATLGNGSGLNWGDTSARIRGESGASGLLRFDTNGGERLRITSDGGLESYSASDANPNFKFRSDDTNWHGYLNQTVHGATISTILSCGGTWTVDGTTYNATKDYNGSFGTAALIVHNQYNSTATGGELVFVTKANGSSTTDGAVTEKFRIRSDGNVVIGTSSYAYTKPLNVQGSTGAILSLSNYDTTSYAADTNTSIELRINTGNTGNQNGACEIRAFKENGTNGNNARGLNFWTAGNGGSPSERLRISSAGYVTKSFQPRALVKIYSTTTMASGKVTNWASPTYNVGSLWDTTNKRFVAPTNGLYLIGGNFRIGAPGKIRVTRFEIRAYNTSNGHMATYGGGVGGGNNYDGGSGGYDHPYVGFTNAIYLQTGQYLELWLGEVGTEHTTYIQQHNEQSHMWCVLLQ